MRKRIHKSIQPIYIHLKYPKILESPVSIKEKQYELSFLLYFPNENSMEILSNKSLNNMIEKIDNKENLENIKKLIALDFAVREDKITVYLLEKGLINSFINYFWINNGNQEKWNLIIHIINAILEIIDENKCDFILNSEITKILIKILNIENINVDLLILILNYFYLGSTISDRFCEFLSDKGSDILDLIIILEKKYNNLLIKAYKTGIFYQLYRLNDSNNEKMEMIAEEIFNLLSIRLFEEGKSINNKENKLEYSEIWLNTAKAIEIILDLLGLIFENDSKIGNFMIQEGLLVQIIDKLTVDKQKKTDEFDIWSLMLKISIQSNILLTNIFKNQLSNPNLMVLENRQFTKIIDFYPIIWQNINNSVVNTIHKGHDLKDLLINQIELLLTSLKNTNFCPINAEEFIFLAEKIINNKQEETFLIFLDVISERFSIKFKISDITIGLIIDFLIKNLKGKGIMVTSQILNVFFDVFCNEDYDYIFHSKKTMENLIEIKEFLIKSCKKHKKNLRKKDLEFVNETLCNLENFIIYKEKNLYLINNIKKIEN